MLRSDNEKSGCTAGDESYVSLVSTEFARLRLLSNAFCVFTVDAKKAVGIRSLGQQQLLL